MVPGLASGRFSILADLERLDKEPLVTSGYVITRPMGGESAERMPRLAPESCRRETGQRAESGAERSQAFIAEIEADIGDALIFSQQHLLGFFDPPAGDKLMRSLAERAREQSIEMKRRKASFPRGGFERNPVPIASAQIIAGSQESRERGGIAKANVPGRCHFFTASLRSHDIRYSTVPDEKLSASICVYLLAKSLPES